METKVHSTITVSRLFKLGDRVAIWASGGKGDAPTFLLYENRIHAQISMKAYLATSMTPWR